MVRKLLGCSSSLRFPWGILTIKLISVVFSTQPIVDNTYLHDQTGVASVKGFLIFEIHNLLFTNRKVKPRCKQKNGTVNRTFTS